MSARRRPKPAASASTVRRVLGVFARAHGEPVGTWRAKQLESTRPFNRRSVEAGHALVRPVDVGIARADQVARRVHGLTVLGRAVGADAVVSFEAEPDAVDSRDGTACTRSSACAPRSARRVVWPAFALSSTDGGAGM